MKKTPKEKAQELVQEFIDVPNLYFYLLEDFEGMDRQLAKECALITVDRILQYIYEINEEYQGDILDDTYLLKVRDEILYFCN